MGVSETTLVSIDVALSRVEGRQTAIKCILDVDASDIVIGLEVLDLAWTLGLNPGSLHAAPPNGGAKHIAFDSEADALWIKLAEGHSRDQLPAQATCSTIRRSTDMFAVRLEVPIPSPYRLPESN